MIPQRLTVTNFLSYRENVPTLDFSTMHVACLCGPNGHGKSALLDAITWCLWGQARGQVQDDLISHGADHMRVELDFTARDTLHRVIRSHNRGRGRRRQGASDLQLQVLHQGSHGLAQPIPGNTIRETQERIVQLIGMDYDTFINSAFLLQGRADEFTSRTPTERKEVLGRVLDLAHYDLLQDRARSHTTQARSQVDAATARLDRMTQEMTELGDPRSSLARHTETLDLLATRSKQQADAAAALEETTTTLQAAANRLTDLDNHHHAVQQDLARLKESSLTLRAAIDAHQRLAGQEKDIRSQALLLEDSRASFETLETKRQQHDLLQKEHAQLTTARAATRARLEAQQDQLHAQVHQQLIPLADQQQDLEQALANTEGQQRLDHQEKQLAQVRTQASENASQQGQARAGLDRLANTGQELRSKLQLLQADDGTQPVCPLCLTPLDQDRCRDIEATCRAEFDQAAAQHSQTQQELTGLQTQATTLQQQQNDLDRTLTEARNLHQAERTRLENRLQESLRAREDLAQATADLEEVQAALAHDTYAPKETQALQQLEERIALLGYDDQERQRHYRQMEDLRPAGDELRSLEQALLQLPQDQEALARALDLQSERETELAGIHEDRTTAQLAAAQLPGSQRQLQEARQAIAQLDQETQQARQQQAVSQHQVERLDQLATDVSDTEKAQSQAARRLDICQELVNSLGRQGVQAMLIESVVPQLEDQANALLGRMTDNRIHLKLDTQRERRSTSGAPIETLDINVHDELGPRSYEMYSGGEAFRINLALRIALSRVLAQRTGAGLPTLFIDEGFGTQDTAGRERVLDAISAIQDEFQKVIVITHLDDLKDAFPVRIEVHKDSAGSTFTIA